MKRFILVLVIISGLALTGYAQQVLYSSQDIHQSYKGPAIKSIRQNWVFSPAITVRYVDGHTERIPKDSIWGYEDRRGRLYRYYKNEFYKIRKEKDVIYYTIQRPNGEGITNHHYFSQDYDTPLRWTKNKARRD
jgi:hypothetical protein